LILYQLYSNFNNFCEEAKIIFVLIIHFGDGVWGHILKFSILATTDFFLVPVTIGCLYGTAQSPQDDKFQRKAILANPNGSSKMQTAPILKSSTVSNYGDIFQFFFYFWPHLTQTERIVRSTGKICNLPSDLPVNLTIRSVFVKCGQK
jgi:hypothetical protein